MRFSSHQEAPFQEVPLVQGVPCLALEVEPGSGVLGFFLECQPLWGAITVSAPWVRVAPREASSGQPGGSFRLLVNPEAAGGPGQYLAQLDLGGQALAVVLRIRSAPAMSGTPGALPPLPAQVPRTAAGQDLKPRRDRPADQRLSHKSWPDWLAVAFLPFVVVVLLGILFAMGQRGSAPDPASPASAQIAQVAPEPGGGGLDSGAPPQGQDPPVSEPPPGRYLVIAGSFRKAGNAQVEMDRVRKAGYGSATVALSDDYPCLRTGYQIVLVGCYGDFDEANRVSSDLKSRGFSVWVADTQRG